MGRSHGGPQLDWGESERMRLRRARKAARHSQQACAELLVARFAAQSASQSDVARWESGKTNRPHCVESLVRYMDEFDPGDHEPIGRAGDTAGFNAIVDEVAGEPLLGFRQGELVDGLIERLRTGPPLTDRDLDGLRSIAGILRMRLPEG